MMLVRGHSTTWKPSEASIEEAIAANKLPTEQEVLEAMGEIKDVRSTTAAAAAAAAAQAAGGDGKLAAFTLQLIDSTFRQVWPSDMFEAGEGQPFVRIKGGTRALLSKSGPVTFIVFPGVISEMIEVGPFGELPIWETSTFAKAWKARLAHCSSAEPLDDWDARGGASFAKEHLVCDKTDTMDKRFFLDDLENKPETMEALVSVGSIDAVEGDDSNVPPGMRSAKSVSPCILPL
jgi:hypothetical protein